MDRGIGPVIHTSKRAAAGLNSPDLRLSYLSHFSTSRSFRHYPIRSCSFNHQFFFVIFVLLTVRIFAIREDFWLRLCCPEPSS